MNTPASPQPAPPAWAVEAAKEIFGPIDTGIWLSEEECVQIIAKHAPNGAALGEAKKYIKRLEESLTAANYGDVPQGWNDAIERAEKAEAELTALKTRLAIIVNVVRGCHDYSGGHHSPKHYEIYHHGIQTVINVVEAAVKNDGSDTQINALINIGAALATPPSAPAAAKR